MYRQSMIFFVLSAALGSMQVGAVEYKFSGFASLTAGKVLGGTELDFNGNACPCNLAGWEYGQLYDKDGWQTKPESVLGLQATAKVNDRLSATVQLVGRSVHEKVSADWAYVGYKLDDNWTVQAGRKRLPMYYLSDSMYVGYTYPWVRPPGEVYGWEISGYNGLNLLFRDQWGDWSALGNIWAGSERTKNNRVQSRIIFGTRVDEAWNSIVGASLGLSNEYVEIRGVYMQNRVDIDLQQEDGSFEPASAGTLTYRNAPQRLYGLSVNADYENWLLKSEVNVVTRDEGFSAPSAMLAAGYRWGDFTAMFSSAIYREKQAAGNPRPTRFGTNSAVVRWDFHRSAALKLQYDVERDMSEPGVFLGNSRLLSVSVSTVF